MTWICTLTNRLSHGLTTLSRLIPPLGAAPTYEFAGDDARCLPAPRANRNRWSRPDLRSAVGQDPHVTDPAVQVWPERVVVSRET